MAEGVIDGDRWIAERIDYLKGLLEGELPDEHRRVVQAEMEKLRNERGYHLGGFRLRWFPSRWLRRSTRHEGEETSPA